MKKEYSAPQILLQPFFTLHHPLCVSFPAGTEDITSTGGYSYGDSYFIND
ncbi:MAG: hypothetical protein J6Y32_06800 [Bacteroidales bacterium]|nr:hypothetical protein [Bacteroidales bacterium]